MVAGAAAMTGPDAVFRQLCIGLAMALSNIASQSSKMPMANAGVWAEIALKPVVRCGTDFDLNQTAKPTSNPIYMLPAHLVAKVL